MLFLTQVYAIVDIETTGSNKNFDRIFDIAIIKHDGEKIVDEFHSFVNPGISIPPFIENLTGISTDMVLNAPSFQDIMERVLDITEDCIFVAHNVSFDYHFIRYEFKRLKIKYQRLQLCSVKLSHSAFPGLEAYSLGRLCEELKIPIQGRHTAYGDTKATSDLFQMIYSQNEDLVAKHIEGDFSGIPLPNDIQYIDLDTFPEDPGVIYFLNSEMEPLYITDSKNIRKKCFDVLKEVSTNPSRNDFFKQITEISYELMGNELIAKITRTTEVLKQRPKFNRVRKRSYSHGIYLIPSNGGVPNLCLTNFHGTDSLIKAFMNKKSAVRAFKRVCGNTDGMDFPRGKEIIRPLENGSSKLLNRLTYPWDQFIIKGDGRNPGESSFVLIRDRQYKGFGFVDDTIDAALHSLSDNLIEQKDSEEIKRVINSYLTKKKRKHVIPIG